MEKRQVKLSIYLEQERKIIAYHGTDKKLTKFDPKKTAQGILWFSEDKDKIIRKEAGATTHGYIYKVELKVDKTAGWEEYDKLMLQQIREQGFDSIKLDDDWIIFDPKRVKILGVEKR